MSKRIVASRPFRINDILLNFKQHHALCQFANVIMSDLGSRHLDTLSDTDIFCLKQLEECGLVTKRNSYEVFAGRPTYTTDYTYLENSELVALCKVAKIIALDVEFEHLRILSKKDKACIELLEKCGFLEPRNHIEGTTGQSVFTTTVILH